MALLKISMLLACLFLLSGAIIIPTINSYSQKSYNNFTPRNDPLELTVSINKVSYCLRESVHIQGMLKQDGSPVSEALVGIEVRDPSGLPVTFRTEPTSNISETSWPVDFVDLYPCDSSGNPKYSFVVKQTLWIGCIVKNFDDRPHSLLVAISLYDGNAIPLGVWYPLSTTLDPGERRTIFFMATKIPAWAYPGNANIYASIFSGFPKDGGVPYCPEKLVSFEIKRNPDLSYYNFPSSVPPTPNGIYFSTFRLSPEQKPGTYNVFVSGVKGVASVHNATTFSVESTSSPPQASFTYTPLEPYVNMSVTFDASSSTAEGYNDTIIKYEWNFGDGTPKVTETTPTTTHVFTEVGTYTVTLNVTDNEGLWCLTSKPITIKPPTGPTASFTWSPSAPGVNQTVTFDASESLPGWNGTAQTPIISYEWNFGDGNTTIVTTPTITHIYTIEGNYTVTLIVTDTNGLQDNETLILTVSPTPQLPGDINGDGVVNYLDAILLGAAFGSKPGDPCYLYRCC